MIPEGWEISTIAGVSAVPVSYGVVQTGDPVEGGIPCVRVVDIAGGDLNRSSMITTSEEVSASYSRTVLKAGDIMIALRGIIGRAAQATEQLEGCNLTRGVARISPKPRVVTSNFLIQALNGPEFVSLINSQANGSALQEISIGTLRKASILLPPLAEQKRISEILVTWDRAIETVKALIDTSRAQKQALMRQLLSGKHRLPGFCGAWQRRPINEIATRVMRRNDGTKLPVLTISSTSGFVRQDEKYSRFMAGKSVETYIQLNKGEFAYNKGNSKTYEFGCIFDLEEYECALVPHVYVCFKLKKDHSHRFYKAIFEADYLAPQLGRIVNTGVRNNGLLNIKPSEFLGTTVPVPPLDEQEAIAAVMEAASRDVIEHEAQLVALRQEKAALMQQLLTGKRRVKLDQKEAA